MQHPTSEMVVVDLLAKEAFSCIEDKIFFEYLETFLSCLCCCGYLNVTISFAGIASFTTYVLYSRSPGICNCIVLEICSQYVALSALIFTDTPVLCMKYYRTVFLGENALKGNICCEF